MSLRHHGPRLALPTGQARRGIAGPVRKRCCAAANTTADRPAARGRCQIFPIAPDGSFERAVSPGASNPIGSAAHSCSRTALKTLVLKEISREITKFSSDAQRKCHDAEKLSGESLIAKVSGIESEAVQ